MSTVAIPTFERAVAHRRAARRILVVDDDEVIRELLVRRLEPEGFLVDQAADGESALAVLTKTVPDLVVLDLMLPGLTGIDVLVALRRDSDVPVILVSGRGAEPDRIVGLELGADDYVVKPFSTRELAARIRSILRRSSRQASGHNLDFDGLSIDPLAREVRVHGALVATTGHEFDLLHHLAASPRQVFTREQLLRAVWDSSGEWQDEATVTEYVHRLRRKIEDDPHRPRRIVTVWGVGYRFER